MSNNTDGSETEAAPRTAGLAAEIDQQVEAGLAAVGTRVSAARESLEAAFGDLRLRAAGVPSDAEIAEIHEAVESTE